MKGSTFYLLLALFNGSTEIFSPNEADEETVAEYKKATKIPSPWTLDDRRAENNEFLLAT